MKSFDKIWEDIHQKQEWGKYPSEPVIRFVARNYYKESREKINILDFGCGGGSNTWYLANEGFSTYAFDGSASAINRVQSILKQNELKADLRIRDALELDYEESFFHCVIDNAVIYSNYLDNIIKMYEIIYKLLKSGGKLFSTSFSTNTTGYGLGTELEKNTFCDITEGSLKGRGIAHFFQKKELEDILLTLGYQNIIIDTLKYTDRESIIEQFLVQAEK